MLSDKFMRFNFEAEPKSSRYSYRSISITCTYKPSCEQGMTGNRSGHLLRPDIGFFGNYSPRQMPRQIPRQILVPICLD